MKTLDFFLEENNIRMELIDNSILKANQTLLIQTSRENKFHSFIEIFNPFNLIIFSHWFSEDSDESIQFKFFENMPSGLYYIKIQNYYFEKSQDGESKESSLIDYKSINFTGKFQNKEWLLTYAIECNIIPGLDIRIAIPKENFPFIMIDSFEGKPVQLITTDIWSNWLVFETTIEDRIAIFGYRSWLSLNYILFSPQSLLEKKSSFVDLNKYLVSEEGIESEYVHIINFSKRIKATSLLGIIHQIIFLIKDFLKFKDQKGEFGAKYALLNRQGDCTEFSALFTALCRVKNIPSRLVAGLKFNSISNSWLRHAWSEFYHNGLWIPVDVVEGYIIGFTPEIIPLFKGNWMAENMAREVKISILPEFENQISTNELVNVYQGLKISFKVYSKSKAPISIPKSSEMRSTISYRFNFIKKQKRNTSNQLFFSSQLLNEKEYIIFSYYQIITDNFNNHPKIINKIIHINENKSTKETEIKILTPEFPSFYEQGVFITTIYGQILVWEKEQVYVS